ncbi:bifunctional ADP-dependent NAD(P)H-hydrate dehydratase/NAD(P)H-hydrate epimerase [Arthrobacter sp.]|uniref:bifunctional ADP-dependent NAD(P)H-hydrate dehydratase/NAD(P)H-hydrate epimerase n=1 Tax=Arthrobacter sp. TaxID=1667 RepID=UPI003A94D969
MLNAYTGTQIRAAEAGLLESGDGDALMRTAAHGLAHHVMALLRARYGAVYGARVAALIGTGNNGGDGLYALARLAGRGVACTAILLGDRAHPEALAAFRRTGGRVIDGGVPASGARGKSRRFRAATEALRGVDLVIDAVLGTGAQGRLSRPEVPDDLPVVACDLPSGVDADTGAALGNVLPADLTVTFGALKTGLCVGAGRLLAGRVEIVDIGLEAVLGQPDLRVTTRADVESATPRPTGSQHKYSRGVLGLVAGSDTYPGAAVLAATAAVNTSVGMLRTLAPERPAALIAAAVPEAVPAAGPDVRVDAWAMGPGIAEDAAQLAAVEQVLGSGQRAVVDASALRALQPSQGHSRLILTPHAGELEDLLGRAGVRVTAADIEADPVRWARWASVGYSSVVLLKGHSTIVVAPDGYTVVSLNGPAQLATAGSGDVLTGMLGAMLATSAAGDHSTHGLVELAAAAAYRQGDAARVAGRDGGFGAGRLAQAAGRDDLA